MSLQLSASPVGVDTTCMLLMGGQVNPKTPPAPETERETPSQHRKAAVAGV